MILMLTAHQQHRLPSRAPEKSYVATLSNAVVQSEARALRRR
jgi:hypothetical protein